MPLLLVSMPIVEPVMPLYRYLLFLFLAGLASFLHASGSGGDAYSWLAKMDLAVRELNYEGTFVYLHNQHMESMRIVHTVDDGKERERLMSLNGLPREVVRDSDSVTCVLPENRAVQVGIRSGRRSIGNKLPNNPMELSSHYDFLLQGEERVANRKAMVIMVVPKDGNRYGHRIYLDAAHGLPLRSDLLNRSGNPVSQIMFTELRVGPEVRKKALARVGPEERHAYSRTYNQPMRVQKIAGGKNKIWVFKSLPDGYKLSVHARRMATDDHQQIEHFVFTDGLATLSVYIERASGDKILDGDSKMGAVHAFGTNVNGFQVTAVGEVPAQTVRQVALSVQYNKDESSRD